GRGGVSWFVWQPGVTGTSYTATTLVPNRSYRLWLQAVGQGGGGSWVAVNFSTLSDLAAPVIYNPVGDPPTISWQAVAGATSYNLRLDALTAPASSFGWPTGRAGPGGLAD